MTLAQAGYWNRAITYAVGSVVLCILASLTGYRIGAVLGAFR